MRLALYHPWTYLRGGIERMLVEYLSRSRHTWTLFTHHYEPESTFPELNVFDVVELSPRVSVRRSIGPLAKAAATMLACRLPDVGAKAMLISSEGMGDFLLARNRMPAAAYCHTPLKIWHDPNTRHALAKRDAGKAAALRVLGPAFHGLDRALWRRYRHVFVNGREIQGRVERAGLVPGGPVEILHPGVNLERFPFNEGPRDHFFLVAGRIVFGKNIELAIDAMSAAKRGGLRARLVIAGIVDEKSKPYLADLRSRAEKLPVEFDIDPTQERLVELYQRCTALVFPSWNEEFGIVPLEAMACGAPVLAVDAGGPRETVIDGRTGWLLPRSPDAFAARMIEIDAAPHAVEPMRRAAAARASEFSWDPFAERLDEVMERIASEAPERAQRRG